MSRDNTAATGGNQPLLRVPPHSAEAERGVLGSILLDASRVMDLCAEQGLSHEAFHIPAHASLYADFIEMSRQGVAIDALTVADRLRSGGRLNTIGGTVFLERLIDQTPTAAHAEYYIEIVRQKYLLRAIIACSQAAQNACYEENQSADLLLGQAEQALLGITENQRRLMLTWAQTVHETMTHIDRLFSLGAGGFTGLPTGFQNLDRKTRGLRGGEMIVLAARPSMGKTSLAMNIAECVARGRDMNNRPFQGDRGRPHAVAIFSLEMSTEALCKRMLCGMAGVPSFQIDGGLINPQRVNQELTRAASDLGKAPIYVDDTGGLDVMPMRATARRLKKRHNIELIVVDYLQLMNCRDFARQGRQLETAAISANLKAMAKELNVPVMVLSQLSRAPEQRGDRSAKPRLSDLRDSGAIEQDADVVLLLRRPSRNPGDPDFEDTTLAVIDVAKHRNGPTGEVRLNFQETLTRFSDRADVASDDEPDDGDETAP